MTLVAAAVEIADRQEECSASPEGLPMIIPEETRIPTFEVEAGDRMDEGRNAVMTRLSITGICHQFLHQFQASASRCLSLLLFIIHPNTRRPRVN